MQIIDIPLEKIKPFAKELTGYSLRYIKHLKPNLKRNYEVIPYSKIQEVGAGMYMGIKR